MHLDQRFKKNRLKTIRIDKTNHVKNRKTFGFGEDIFDFSESLRSIDIEELNFINYFSGPRSVMFKFVKKEYKKLLHLKTDLDNEYEMKVVNVEHEFNKNKLTIIYSKTIEQEIEEIPLMYKLKNLINPNLQLYVICVNGVFKVCFIDIYHLAIPTKEQNVKEIYLENCNNRYDLSNLDANGRRKNFVNNEKLESVGN